MRPTWLRRRGRAVAAAVVLAAVLTACGGSAQHDNAASRPHPPATLGGVVMSDPVSASIARLPLTTAAGQRTTLAAYRGKIVMIADSLTLCQDMCPMISANVAAMARQVQAAGLAGRIALLEITVDPQRDTPARLAAYQKMFGSPQPAWTLATATTAAATAALWKFFHVYYHRQPTDDPDATDWLTGRKLTYDVEHSNTLIFLSADGKQRYIVDAAADTGDNRPPPALIRFMTPQGRHNLYHPSPGGSWTVPQEMQVLSWLAGRSIATGSS